MFHSRSSWKVGIFCWEAGRFGPPALAIEQYTVGLTSITGQPNRRIDPADTEPTAIPQVCFLETKPTHTVANLQRSARRLGHFLCSATWVSHPSPETDGPVTVGHTEVSSYGHGSKARTPGEHPNPTTEIGSNMGGEFTYQPKWDPKTVLTTTATCFTCATREYPRNLASHSVCSPESPASCAISFCRPWAQMRRESQDRSGRIQAAPCRQVVYQLATCNRIQGCGKQPLL